MRIEFLLEAIQTPKISLFQEKKLCQCNLGTIFQDKSKEILLRDGCSYECICALIIEDKISNQTD